MDTPDGTGPGPLKTPPGPAAWGIDGGHFPTARKIILFAPGLLAAAVLGALVGLLTTPVAGALVFGAVAALSWVVIAGAGGWAVRRANAHGAPSPRMRNLAEGVASRCGLPPPRVLVSERGGPNAFAVWNAGRPVIVVTRSLIDDYPRTEIEAVVAHCLMRIAQGTARYSAAAARLGSWAVSFAPAVGETDDVAACSITRYPPALASAIAKADPGFNDRLGPLLFVWSGESHVPSEQREEALSQL